MPDFVPEIISIDSSLSVDFWASMPETKPHYELIEGELKRKKLKRQMDVAAISQLAFQLFSWGEPRGWSFLTGGFGLRADNYNGFVPDAIGLTPNPHPDTDAVYTDSAFLVADVIWGTTANDREAKKRGYARAEVELYLIVDASAKTIEVYRLNGDTCGEPEILSSHAVWQPSELAGLKLELAKLWM